MRALSITRLPGRRRRPGRQAAVIRQIRRMPDRETRRTPPGSAPTAACSSSAPAPARRAPAHPRRFVHRALLALALAALVPTAGCYAVAGGMVVGGGASLYGAKVAHGDCGKAQDSHERIACFWNDVIFTLPLFALGVALIGTGIGVGVYTATHDH